MVPRVKEQFEADLETPRKADELKRVILHGLSVTHKTELLGEVSGNKGNQNLQSKRHNKR